MEGEGRGTKGGGQEGGIVIARLLMASNFWRGVPEASEKNRIRGRGYIYVSHGVCAGKQSRHTYSSSKRHTDLR